VDAWLHGECVKEKVYLEEAMDPGACSHACNSGGLLHTTVWELTGPVVASSAGTLPFRAALQHAWLCGTYNHVAAHTQQQELYVVRGGECFGCMLPPKLLQLVVQELLSQSLLEWKLIKLEHIHHASRLLSLLDF
jgi:hypothetical protein